MGAPSSPTDEDLMRAYVAGDHAAMRELYHRYASVLLGLTRRHLPTDEEAREVVQQTFFQLHVARADFRLDASLRPWLFTIAMNLVRQYYRKRKVRRESPLFDGALGSTEPGPTPLERSQDAAQVREALAQLPEGQREVVELHWLEGRPFAEVADKVGASEGAVRVRASRAYARLRKLLGRQEGSR